MQQYNKVIAKLRRIQRLADRALQASRIGGEPTVAQYANEIINQAMDLITGSDNEQR